MNKTLFILIAFCTILFADNNIMSAEGGRFVLGYINDLGKNTYMLDTKTGRVWRIVKAADDRLVLEEINYTAPGGKLSYGPLEVDSILKMIKDQNLHDILFGDIFQDSTGVKK